MTSSNMSAETQSHANTDIYSQISPRSVTRLTPPLRSLSHSQHPRLDEIVSSLLAPFGVCLGSSSVFINRGLARSRSLLFLGFSILAKGRKKGASKAKSKCQLSLGDLVLAKVKDHPAWPAKISKPEDWQQTPDLKKHFVHLFEIQKTAFVAPVDIQIFTSETETRLAARCQGKTVKYFAQAVKEICAAFDESQREQSNSQLLLKGHVKS
ncbi:ENHANCER OF AG-4 protein 2-like [Syzygium oleosum]|uniref:ENHANCER OF AG-4 protein 2-like n=1 Tax=Syzygium oleosum TaxID=219896 RepID=UPI0024B8D4C8|nr:ENHANCER OF AG-4 protein 2-like [Syzygium oleosum]